ncbi:hypothetical protein LQZ19_09875 [Treponema primitia]|uniref:hypothetical protein n=1 Tax=Treponema primitia TaxID=88058 RepID=UPI003980AB2F
MSITNLFSKRMKVERGEVPDVYQYDNFEKALRVKVVYIIKDVYNIFLVTLSKDNK